MPVVRDLAGLGHWPPVVIDPERSVSQGVRSAFDQDLLAAARRTRERLVDARSAAYLLAVASVALVALGMGWNNVRDLIPVPSKDVVGAAQPFLPGFVEDVLSRPNGGGIARLILGCVALVAAATLWYRTVVSSAWAAWEHAKTAAMFRRSKAAAWARFGFVALALIPPVVAYLTLPFDPAGMSSVVGWSGESPLPR